MKAYIEKKLKKQREICSQLAFDKSQEGAILNAPSPVIDIETAQQAPEPVGGWTKNKPELPESECLLLTASFVPVRSHWVIYTYRFAKIQDDDGWYLGVVMADDGEEWGDYKDIGADLYKIIPIPNQQ